MFPELFLKSSFHRAARFERIYGYRGSAPQSKWKTLAAVLKDPKCRSRLAYNLYEEFDARYFPQENDPLESMTVPGN